MSDEIEEVKNKNEPVIVIDGTADENGNVFESKGLMAAIREYNEKHEGEPLMILDSPDKGKCISICTGEANAAKIAEALAMMEHTPILVSSLGVQDVRSDSKHDVEAGIRACIRQRRGQNTRRKSKKRFQS